MKNKSESKTKLLDTADDKHSRHLFQNKKYWYENY